MTLSGENNLAQPPTAAGPSGKRPPSEWGTYTLADRYRATEGTVLLTGIQALARIPIEQLRRDAAAGKRTGAFLSGYPGSPLGGFDLEMTRARALVPELDIVHQPAVNEELGATAVMGSQLAPGRPDATNDGVVGFWYGKAPGLDRAGDALRHGVFAGASPDGGAVVLVGDDPGCKSSTMPSSSDATLVDLHMPVLYPGTVAECLELGLHAVAVSRATGLWSAIKIVAPVADGSGLVQLPLAIDGPILPPIEVDGQVWRCQPSAQFLGPRMLEVEREFRQIRIPAAVRYGSDNHLNRITVNPSDGWIGLVATGFTYVEMLEALKRLGFHGADQLADAGIRVLQLRMPVPLDPALIRRFARGLEEVVVVEEKNPTLETLVKEALYRGPDQPLVVGKSDENGNQLMPAWGQLDADAMVDGLRTRLGRRLAERMTPPRPSRSRTLLPLATQRSPYFCSGCPHNWGTKVPDEVVVGAGTGCHGMVLLMDAERVGDGIGITAMGNEGSQWIGMAPWLRSDHLFQNFGDGTIFHSGQLSIQNCIAAGQHMTFKILYNATVAMTGGQDAPHQVGVPDLARIMLAHGVKKVAITTEDASRYKGVRLPKGVKVHDRRRMIEVQEMLRNVQGVTVLIHDQECAAEVRRDRRRGRAVTPTERIVINPRVCEGCGDCGDVSNCLSVQPVDTVLGRKTTIDQASCNYDASCLDGDCPAFMTVEPGSAAQLQPHSAAAAVDPALPSLPPDPPDPVPRRQPDDGTPVRLRLAGVGGTGVVTAAQILSTAAMFDGWQTQGLDQTGLSQKAGPVVSDVVLSSGHGITSNLVGREQADTIVAFDQLTAASDRVLAAADPATTALVASTAHTPTGTMITAPEIPYPTEAITQRLSQSTGADRWLVDSRHLAETATGQPATANMVLLGVAVQVGVIPVSVAAMHRAIELNGVAVDANRAAFEGGRRWAHAPDATAQALATATTTAAETVDPYQHLSVPALPPSLRDQIPVAGTPGELIETLAADLLAYQNQRYAARFVALVALAAEREQAIAGEAGTFTDAVARNAHKVMAYKDEYEVARLLLLPESRAMAQGVAGANATVRWHLHPPMLAALGVKRKIPVGQWAEPALRVLAAGKRLRGTPLDPFGRTALRRAERQLVADFHQLVRDLTPKLRSDNRDRLVEILNLVDQVRGYEQLKIRRIAQYYQAMEAARSELER